MKIKLSVVKVLINLFLSLVFYLHLAGCVTSDVNASESMDKSQTDKELVILAHGLGRSDWAMWRFAQRLQDANYQVCRLDYATIGENVGSVLAETSRQMDACIINAKKVHFVGHSLGGLVIRAYLQRKHKELGAETIGEVVLIGTPNKGSELADHYKGSWLMDIGGGISRALVTGNRSLGNNLDELPLNIGVIAGTKSSSLTSDKFNGPNDGLVSVESTKLKGMSDFIAIEVNHTQMRYNGEVAAQTIHFLQKGRFKD